MRYVLLVLLPLSLAACGNYHKVFRDLQTVDEVPGLPTGPAVGELITNNRDRVKSISNFEYGLNGMCAIVTTTDGKEYYLDQRKGRLLEYPVPPGLEQGHKEIFDFLQIFTDLSAPPNEKSRRMYGFFSERKVFFGSPGDLFSEEATYRYKPATNSLNFFADERPNEDVYNEFEYIFSQMHQHGLSGLSVIIPDEEEATVNYEAIPRPNYEFRFKKEDGKWKIYLFHVRPKGD